jgi:hypothetical protein
MFIPGQGEMCVYAALRDFKKMGRQGRTISSASFLPSMMRATSDTLEAVV